MKLKNNIFCKAFSSTQGNRLGSGCGVQNESTPPGGLQADKALTQGITNQDEYLWHC